MTDILIRGMDIPMPGVYTCELGVLDANTAILTIYTPICESQKSYKFVPLPEGHGRLGDLDALMENIGDVPYKGSVRRVLLSAPTFVPANGR